MGSVEFQSVRWQSWANFSGCVASIEFQTVPGKLGWKVLNFKFCFFIEALGWGVLNFNLFTGSLGLEPWGGKC